MKVFKSKKFLTFCVSIFLAVTVAVGGFGIYVSDYYHADGKAINEFIAQSATHVQGTYDPKGITTYGKEDAEYGFIFYPGGKVEATAYEPLLYSLASNGVFCVLVEMPFNLAVLDMNAADGICEEYSSVQNWYIGGHSLGGSMAAYYIKENQKKFEGLILLASYSTKDLSQTGLRALSVFGSEDGVMNQGKYEKYRAYLPIDSVEVEIEGGCHAYFGMYGAQKGDGVPTITAQEQITKTSEYIVEFMSEGGN